jgi:hypothetical protein
MSTETRTRDGHWRGMRREASLLGLVSALFCDGFWLRGVDLNHRPLGYEPNELPDCSTPRIHHNNRDTQRQTLRAATTGDGKLLVSERGAGFPFQIEFPENGGNDRTMRP